MKSYEMMLIFIPEMDEGAVNEEVSKITSVIEKSKGTIQGTELWGVKKLAYPIKHQDNGFYTLINFNSDTSILPELDRVNKINDKILRHLIVKTGEGN